MNRKLLLLLPLCFVIPTYYKKNELFPLTDLHIHLKGNFGMKDAIAKSRAENISYGQI